jgi:hypothetical protein
MVTALCYLLNTVFACFGIYPEFLSHISGMSLLPWLFILIATHVFRFCAYHRMFLYYILVSSVISIVDYYIGIPLDAFNIITLNFIVAGIFLFIILYLYVRHHKKAAGEDTQ